MPARALELLELVQVPSAERRLGLSARAFRRVAPARHDRVGAGLRPRLLLADEPTTALDATVQIQVLLLLRGLQRDWAWRHLRHPRPRRRRRNRRPHRRHVRWQGGRGRPGRCLDARPAASLSAWPAGRDGARPEPRRRHRGDPRQPARSASPAAGLRVRAPLCEGAVGVPCPRCPNRAVRRRTGWRDACASRTQRWRRRNESTTPLRARQRSKSIPAHAGTQSRLRNCARECLGRPRSSR